MQYDQKKTSCRISRPWLESLTRIGALFAAGVGSLCLTAQPVQAQQAQAGHDEQEAAAHEANTKSRVPKLKVVKNAKDEEIRSPGRAARTLEDGVPAGLISDEKAAAQFRKAFSLARLTLEGVELMGETEIDIRRRFAGCTEVASFSAAKVLSCERPKNFAGSGEYVLFSFMPVSRLLVGIQTYFADIEASQRTYAAWTKALADRYDAYEEQFVQAVDSVFWRISLGRDARGQGRWLRVQVNDEQELTATERFLQLDVGERNLGTLVFGETTSATVPAASRECEAAVYNNAYDKDYLGNCFGFPYDAHFQLEFSDKSGVLRQVVLSPLSQVTVELIRQGNGALHGRGNNIPFHCPSSLQWELLEFAKENHIQTGPVFITRRGTPMNRSTICRLLQELSRTAGIPENKVSPRSLRNLCQIAQEDLYANLEQMLKSAYDQLLETENTVAGWKAGA